MTKEGPKEWIACRFDISEEHYDYVEEKVKQYGLGDYVIGFEKSSKSHYHILMEGNDKIYKNFSKVLKEKFNLNKNGKKHQYRKEKEVRSVEQYKTYILKDGNYRSNLDAEEIKKLYDQSYQKEDINPKNEEIVQELIKEEVYKLPQYKNSSYENRESILDFMSKVKIIIIDKLLKKDLSINKCRVNKIYQLYIQQHNKVCEYNCINHSELIYFNLFR